MKKLHQIHVSNLKAEAINYISVSKLTSRDLPLLESLYTQHSIAVMAQASHKVLFEVPISTGGSIKCSSPVDKVYLVEFTSPPDNRLTTPFCKAFMHALDILEFNHEHGVVITTSGIAKFYSNGLDLEHAFWNQSFFPDALYALWRRLLLYANLHFLISISQLTGIDSPW